MYLCKYIKSINFLYIIKNIKMTQYSNASTMNKTFKIILVGPSSVGKSCLLVRYVDNSFNSIYNTTVGLDFRSKKIEYEDQCFTLELWDSAGQERYRTIVINYFKLTKAACVIFDVTKPQTLQQTEWWFKQLQTHCGEIIKVLIGNKMDQLGDSSSSKQQKEAHLQSFSAKIKILEQQFGCRTFYTSAKTGQGVEEVFDYLTKEIYKKYKVANRSDQPVNIGMKLTSTVKPTELSTQKQKKKDCC